MKKLTAPHVDTLDTADVKRVGQTFSNGTASRELVVEKVSREDVIQVRGSEAVFIFSNETEVSGS